MHKLSNQVISVDNAKRGAGHKVLNFLHNSLSPATYPCDLCVLIYGSFQYEEGVEKLWGRPFLSRSV